MLKMDYDGDVKLKFGPDLNLDDIFTKNWKSGVFQTLKIICKDGEEVYLNPMFVSLIFPWLRGKVLISEFDLILLPEHDHLNIKQTIAGLLRSYKNSVISKCEVKLEDLLEVTDPTLDHLIDATHHLREATHHLREATDPSIDTDDPISCNKSSVVDKDTENQRGTETKENEDCDEDDSKLNNHIEESHVDHVEGDKSNLQPNRKSLNKKKLGNIKSISEDANVNKNKVTCSICDNFLNVVDMKKHMMTQHSDVFNNIKATKNVPKIKIESAVEKETRKHKPRLCPECGKSVKNLSKHSLIHKGIKPERLQCHVCEKTLCSANALKVHIESVHEGIKRFPCNLCSTSFVYEAYLKHHIQVVHEGYRPPEATCPDCGKQFKFMSNMTRHRRITHHGESIQRRHFCQLCKALFMKVSLLHKHMREEHGINPRKRGEIRRALETDTGDTSIVQGQVEHPASSYPHFLPTNRSHNTFL